LRSSTSSLEEDGKQGILRLAASMFAAYGRPSHYIENFSEASKNEIFIEHHIRSSLFAIARLFFLFFLLFGQR